MTFRDIELDRAYSYRSLVGEQGNTAVVELGSGAEERIQRWGETRLVANLGYAIKTYADLTAILAFKRAMGHRLDTFRFWNPLDYSTGTNTPSDTSLSLVTNADEQIGTGDAADTTFQLVKRYTNGVNTVTRNLTKPITGTVKVALDAVAKTEGVDFTVNYSTGIVTFTSAPGNGVDVTAGCQFNDEVRFESDDSSVSIDSYERGDVVGGLRIVSVMGGSIVNDDFPYRGSSTPTFGADMDLTPQMGALVRLDPSTSGLSVILPDPSPYPYGGPHWLLENISGSDSFDVVYNGVTVATVAAGDWCELWLGLDISSNPEWIAYA